MSMTIEGLQGRGGGIETQANSEVLKPVNIRRVDTEKDWGAIVAIAGIFNEPNIIEHLSGIAPAKTERNIAKFRKNISRYIPDEMSKNISEEGLKRIAENLIRATPAAIKEYFTRLGNNAEVYVAEAGARIVGTATLEKPSGPGKMYCTISKVAVSCNAPKMLDSSRNGKGVARQLINFLDNRINDLGYIGAEVSVVKRVAGRLAPLDLFMNDGYDFVGETNNGDLGWDNREKKYVFRDIIKLQRNTSKNSQ
jgi:hypothetical protein